MITFTIFDHQCFQHDFKISQESLKVKVSLYTFFFREKLPQSLLVVFSCMFCIFRFLVNNKNAELVHVFFCLFRRFRNSFHLLLHRPVPPGEYSALNFIIALLIDIFNQLWDNVGFISFLKRKVSRFFFQSWTVRDAGIWPVNYENAPILRRKVWLFNTKSFFKAKLARRLIGKRHEMPQDRN